MNPYHDLLGARPSRGFRILQHIGGKEAVEGRAEIEAGFDGQQ